MLIKMANGAEHLKVFHTHDCDKCVFLGHVGLEDRMTGKQDVWYCPDEGTLILRSGQYSEYQTVLPAVDYPADHSSHDAWSLLQNFQLADSKFTEQEVIPQDQKNSDEAESEADCKVIVGLYEDIKVYFAGTIITVADSHDAELMVGKWNDKDSGWYEMHVVAEWVAASDSIMKFRTQRSMFLYAMYLQQLGDDYGY